MLKDNYALSGGQMPSRRFQPAALIAALIPEVNDKIVSFAVFDVLDSTNEYLVAKGPVPTGCFALCIAASQTHGRGRRGRSWVSPAGGNVYLSLSWRGEHDVQRDNWVGLMIAVELARYLSGLGKAFVGVKWPNDLYCDGAKLGGVLIEKTGNLYVAGFGLNVAVDEHQADGIDGRWTSLSNVGIDDAYQKIVASVINVIVKTVDCIADETVASMQKLYRPFDLAYGQKVEVHSDEGRFSGIARGPDARGLLRVKTARGIKTCSHHESSIRL